MGFVVNIKRVLTGLFPRRKEQSHSISDEEIVRRLEKAVVLQKLYLHPSLTLVQVSKEIAVNRTYLTRALKSIDTNYKDYINTFRIQYAIKLLMEKPDYSNCEIAELSGFGTLKTMDSYLRKRVGVTSANIRKRGASMKSIATAVVCLFSLLASTSRSDAQSVRIKTNLLHDAVTAVNAGVEFPLTEDCSIVMDAVFPFWCDREENKYALQIKFYDVEIRKYFSKHSRNRLFAGFFGGYGKACIQINSKNGHRINDLFMAGADIGCEHRLNGHWLLQYGIGIGYSGTDYDMYRIEKYNGNQYLASQADWRYHLSLFPFPARVEVSLVYSIGGDRNE